MKSSTLHVGTIQLEDDEPDLETADVFAAASNPFLAKSLDDFREASFNVTDPEYLAAAVVVDPNRPIVPPTDVHGDMVEADVTGSVRFQELDRAQADNATANYDASDDENDEDHFEDDEVTELESGQEPQNRSSLIAPELPADEEKKNNAKRRSVAVTGTQLFRYLCSLGLLVFSIAVVMAAVFTGQTAAAEKNIPPVGAFFIFWFLIIWLAMVRAHIANVEEKMGAMGAWLISHRFSPTFYPIHLLYANVHVD